MGRGGRSKEVANNRSTFLTQNRDAIEINPAKKARCNR